MVINVSEFKLWNFLKKAGKGLRDIEMYYRGRVHATKPFRTQRLTHDVWAATSSVALNGVWQLDKTRKPRMCRFPSLFRDFVVMMSSCYVTRYQETLTSCGRWNFILIHKSVKKQNNSLYCEYLYLNRDY